MARGRPKTGLPTKEPRSIRVSDPVWQAAQRRAEREGTTVNAVAATIVEAYARGTLTIPRTATAPAPAAGTKVA